MTGLFLIFLEFFIPGTIMAIGGTLMLLASLLLFYFQVQQILLFLAYAALLGIALFITIRLAMKRINKGKILNTSDQAGFQASNFQKELIGKLAIATSDLKPAGYVEIDGKIFAALSQLGYIDRNARVRIVGGQGNHLIVSEEKHADSAGASH